MTLALGKIFFFPYNPPHSPTLTKPPPVPPEKLNFGSVWLRLAPFRLRSAPFGSVSGLFRVRFGSVSGPFRGVGWGRGEGLL